MQGPLGEELMASARLESSVWVKAGKERVESHGGGGWGKGLKRLEEA